MTLFIQGLAIPLDVKNVNGWGIPSSELDNAVTSLKASQLRICPGEAHACDLPMDPKGRIGHIIDAWEELDGIHAKAEVTDSEAARKLKEGTWNDYKWSIVVDSNPHPRFNNGWTTGTKVKALTLVKNPAYSQARYQVAAAVEENAPVELHLFSDFQLIASDESLTKSIEGDPIPEDYEKTISELTASKAELEKKITELTASVEDKTKALNVAVNDISEAKTALEAAEKNVTELTASVDELKKEVETKEKTITEKTTLVASLEKEREGTVPMNKLETLIAAAIEKHDADKVAEAERQDAFRLFASALDPDAKIEDYPNLTAADFKRLTDTVGVKLAASAQIRYPASNNNSSGWTVGRPKTDGSWEA
jgi:predicted  nucleic acid-binding Zn-ribbon protein